MSELNYGKQARQIGPRYLVNKLKKIFKIISIKKREILN